MSSNNGRDNAQHSAPIPINTRGRSRSASMSSGYSSGGSPSSPSLPATPMTGSMSSPKIGVQGGSPIMSYFLAQSPTKPAATFPFRRFGATPVFEEEEGDQEPPATAHARRASTQFAGRLGAPQVIPGDQKERGTGLLRRLSIGGAAAFARPTAEMLSPTSRGPPSPSASPITPSSATTRVPPTTQMRKARRSNTVSESRPRRAPSPMGERILKGHFDGFN
ncbi:hypothetical protein EV714DRAFT_237680 [Schizophyllum commune]